MVETNTTRVPKKGVHSMYKKIVEGIVAHVIAGVVVSGVSIMAAELLKIDFCRKVIVNRKSISNKITEK